MGKALIIIVLGAGIILAKQLYNAHEGGNRTATDQRNYQEELLAREIATSAFNVGMGEIRGYGANVRQAVTAFNGPSNAGRTGTFTSGKYAGGKYTVRALLTSGHSVRLEATGFYGTYVDDKGETQYRGEFMMHDEYRVNVLIPRVESLVNVQFIESMAGYCSAVFMQTYPPGTPEGARPEPVLIYSPDNRDRRTARPAREIVVPAGTQMNFFIAVDQNCSERPPTMNDCQGRAYAADYDLALSQYQDDGTGRSGATFDHIHYALELEAGHLEQAREALWGIVEQNPTDGQRWRLAWEDIHNKNWDRPNSTRSPESLQATKTYGYDGVGWPVSNSSGYALLKDFGGRPDFSDQVIEVTLTPTASSKGQERMADERAALTTCGLPIPPEMQPPPPTGGGTTTEPPPTTGGGTTTEPPPETNGPTCRCQGSDSGKKVALMHRPPGNESNEHVICISVNGLNGHKRHNDYEVCRGND